MQPTWQAGQTFLIEAQTQVLPPKSERGIRALDPAASTVAGTMDASDSWSDPLWWETAVLETGSCPAEGEPLYEAATRGGGP